ncbi:MAG: hypothetical protein MK209_03670 [Planctomycetes bacterium]|nr:hypothetical protein [Planctomycetota bacterium]
MLLATLAPAAPSVWIQVPARAAERVQEEWRNWVADLAPPYIREDGRGPNQDAVAPLLRFLLIDGGPPTQAEDAERARVMVFERLAPNLEAQDCGSILEGLRSGEIIDLESAHNLLLAARVSESGPTLLAIALDKDRDIQLRAHCVSRLLAAEGRPVLESLQELIDPETEAVLLRQIYAAWTQMVVEEDLPRLENLVRQGPGLIREYALQTWARVETRPDKRVDILRLSETSANSFRSVLFREVAAQGPAPEVAEYVRSLFDAPRIEDRRLALSMLASFASPKSVFEEWKARQVPTAPLSTQGSWMNQLARLPLEDAQRVAAEWLVDSGWQESRYGMAVAQTLGQRAISDDYLSSFLPRAEVPIMLRVQLAADRAPHSEDARAWLRRTVPEVEGILGVRMVRALGELGKAEDRIILVEIAGDPGRPGLLRAEAVRALLRVPGGVDALFGFVAEPPLDFETAEAVVESAVLAGDIELREQVHEAVAQGFGLPVESNFEREALWRTLWRAQARAALRSDADALVAEAQLTLLALPEEDPTAPWPDPRALRGEFLSLVEVVQALAATAPARAFLIPESTAVGQPVSRLGLVVWAEASFTSSPDACAKIAASLAADPGLLRGNRMRALGLAARASRSCGNQNAEFAALNRILGLLREDFDESDLVDLGYGLGLVSPRAWLLPLDEVGQRLVLSEARGFEAGRGAVLGPLLEGGCRLETLLEAGELLAEVESWSAALRFARRAADFEPANARARWQVGRAYEGIDLLEEAVEAYSEAVRLGSTDPATARRAASRLQILATR